MISRNLEKVNLLARARAPVHKFLGTLRSAPIGIFARDRFLSLSSFFFGLVSVYIYSSEYLHARGTNGHYKKIGHGLGVGIHNGNLFADILYRTN